MVIHKHNQYPVNNIKIQLVFLFPGTSIIASNLFKNIPVRRQYYRSDKNKKEELKKIEDILVSFGCIKTGML